MEIESLNKQFRLLQKAVHPDRFVNATDSDKKQSMIKSTEINEAYQTLKDPISRASHIISLHENLKEETLPPEFLMQQMEWEEELEDSNDAQQLDNLAHQIDEEKNAILNLLTVQLDEKKDYQSALVLVGKLKFITSLYKKIKQKTFSMDPT